jgi:hypothetical protein
VLSCSNARLTVAHCLLVGNRPEGTDGAAVYSKDSDVLLVNCTVADNLLGLCGGGFRIVGGQFIFSNSIFWGNTYNCWSAANDGFSPAENADVLVHHSIVPSAVPGPGNLETDPLFVRRGRWVHRDSPDVLLTPDDPDAVWDLGDYHLRSGAGRWDPLAHQWMEDSATSPGIDGGDPASPIGLEPEPNGAIVNMGAYGGTSEAGKSR